MFSYGLAMEDKRNSGKQWVGKYPAKVIDTSDPESRGRVRVVCPHALGGGESDWAEGCFPPGLFFTPPVGSYVWIEFFQGDPEFPIWVGQFYPRGMAPTGPGLAALGDSVTVTVTVSGSDPQGGTITLTGTGTGTVSAVASKAKVVG